MKTKSVKTLITLLFFLCFLRLAWAKDYSIEFVRIDAQLNSDGSMDVKEERVYSFKGGFHWATYFLPIERTGGVTNFTLGEKDYPYVQSEGQKEGTYQFRVEENLMQAKWFFEAKDQSKTFIISYKVLDVVKLYEDAAVLYYKFVGRGWDKSSQQINVNIHPPQPIEKEKIKAWVHGPLWGTIEILNDGKIIADVEQLPPRTFWEVRVIYPPELFSQVKNVIPEKVVPTILAKEKEWSLAANQQREEWLKKREMVKQRKKYGALLISVLSLIGLAMIVPLYLRFGKKHKVPFSGRLYSEIPSDLSPAFLSYLLYWGNISGTALVGTILDLAQKGFLKIKEKVETKKFLFITYQKKNYTLEINRDFYSKNQSSLQNFETSLVDFIFNELSEGKDMIDFDELKGERRSFMKWFSKWKKEVKEVAEEKKFWEKDSFRARNKGFVVGIFLFAFGIVSIFFIQEWAFVGIGSAIVLIILSFLLPRRTPEAELEAKKWLGLRNYLKKYHFRESGSRFLIENIGKFLVYGVVLGLSKDVIKKMGEMIPEGEYGGYVPWYVYSGGRGGFSPSGFAEGLSSLMASATSTFSSASGAGGGASGGGGGGAGGSGGGAG
jgi:uncharacterized membrane protein